MSRALPGCKNAVAISLFAVLLPCWAAAADVPAGYAAEDSAPLLEEIIITAPEPRYVSPTRRDRIGRIWAPVFINEKGPFRLVLDTGASHSGISAEVAAKLGLEPKRSDRARLLGVTGSAVVGMVNVDSLVVGDMALRGKRLPIITDPLGGAEGILGSEGLTDKRVYIDFRNDFIRINRSKGERAADSFITIPVKFARGKLLTVDARIGNLPITAIIDTGAEVTIANIAARDAMSLQDNNNFTIDRIQGATADIQEGERHRTPAITIGNIVIRTQRLTFIDLHIFKHWKMTEEPALLIGMDALGLLDTLVIDYRRAELHMKMR